MAKATTATTTNHTATNRYGIVEQFSFTNENHPWVKVTTVEGIEIANVTIPKASKSKVRPTALIVPYGMKEAGMLERWLKVSVLHNIKQDANSITFQCSPNYLNGKFWERT